MVHRPDTALQRPPRPLVCDQAGQAALSYRETAIPNYEAFAWTIRSVSATHAVHIRHHGWTPKTYSNLLALCIQQTPEIDAADEWIGSPIVWRRALRQSHKTCVIN